MTHFTRRTLPRDLATCAHWPMPDVSSLSERDGRRFTIYKELIEAYLGGAAMKPLLSAYNIPFKSLLRQLDRCVTFCDSGTVFGWHALLPYVHVKSYDRRAPMLLRETCSRGGYSGALGLLFAKFPDIQAKLDAHLLTGRRGNSVPESKVTPGSAHGYFLSLCDQQGVPTTSWPFSVVRLGKTTLSRYVRRFYDSHYDDTVLAQHGPRAMAKAQTGRGFRSRVFAPLPLDVVELDEHSAQFVGAISIHTSKGKKWVPIQRLTIILLGDRCSSAALAYLVIVRREPKAQDILSVVAKALCAWQPRDMSLPGYALSPGSGMPSALFPQLSACGFVKLLVDNHLSHLAKVVEDRLCNMAGCVVNYGQAGHFERRPLIERIFKALEEAGFRRIPSATGADPRDPRRNKPTQKAIKHCMSLESLLDLIEAVIAKYNASSTSGDFGSSPLEQLRAMLEDDDLGFLPPWIPPRLQHEPSLDTVIEHGKIGGSRKDGVRPYIPLDRVHYTNPRLASRLGLIGKGVVKQINEDNIQSFDAYLESGESLGTVHAMGRWGDQPHSRLARREINAMLDSGELRLTRGESPVVAWLACMGREAERAAKSASQPKVSRAANVLAEEQRRGNVVASEDYEGDAFSDTRASRAASDEAARRVLAPVVAFKAIN